MCVCVWSVTTMCTHTHAFLHLSLSKQLFMSWVVEGAGGGWGVY